MTAVRRIISTSTFLTLAAASVIGLFARPLKAQGRLPGLDSFFTRTVGLDANQMAALSRGEVVKRVLRTADDRDVSVIAVAHVEAPRSRFESRERDLANALRTPTRRAFRIFSSPADAADVQPIEVTSKDLDELKKCRPGDCNFKLPGSDMEQLRATIDWSAPDAASRVSAYVRQRMLEYVADYRQGGNAAMVVYDDNGVKSSDALVSMLNDSTYVFRAAPSLGRHLLEYPHDSLAGAIEVMFWSLDNLPHVRQVLRITHETVYSPPELLGTTIVAAKQIYADHYFEAGLETLTAVDDLPSADGASPAGFTMIAVRRYRFDHLPSGGLLNLRGRVINGLRDNVRDDVARLKREIESG
ncbi:MAG: hypothetical protein ACJ796_01035 [Gemmatimonadaceae bacterium]